MKMRSRAGTCRVSGWSAGSGGPRVLVESPEAWAYAPSLEEAGYSVATCRGPDESEACPLLADGVCTAADEADVIVAALPTADNLPIADAHARRHPDTPVVAEAPQPSAHRYRGRAQVLPAPAREADLLAALGSILGAGDGPGPADPQVATRAANAPAGPRK